MGWRQIRKQNLRAVEEVYARAVEQERYLRYLNARNWAMWNDLRKRNSAKEVAEELHQQAHENITPPWED